MPTPISRLEDRVEFLNVMLDTIKGSCRSQEKARIEEELEEYNQAIDVLKKHLPKKSSSNR